MKKEKKEPIRILNVVPNMRAAGIESFIMNVYRNIDRDKVQFDFLVHSKNKEFYDDEIIKMGGRIYRLTLKDDKNFVKYYKDLKDFFNNHREYSIVHGHMQSMMPLYLFVAKKCNIKHRIAHSHNNSYEKSLKGFILHIFSRFSRYYSNLNLACSKDAGKYLFGNKKYYVINNGIDVNKFMYDRKIREKYRNEFGLNDSFVIGHVGRFEKQKNHKFLIKIFSEIKKVNSSAVLLLVGEGKLYNKVKKDVEEWGLSNSVKFMGIRNDISNLMQAMDCFVLPSLYEGLGIVLIEAQSSGLKCFATKGRVAAETNVSDNIIYIDLNKNESEWANQIINLVDSSRKVDINRIKKDFDIKNISNKFQNMYLSMEADDDNICNCDLE